MWALQWRFLVIHVPRKLPVTEHPSPDHRRAPAVTGSLDLGIDQDVSTADVAVEKSGFGVRCGLVMGCEDEDLEPYRAIRLVTILPRRQCKTT